jgi:hypothetical protein
MMTQLRTNPTLSIRPTFKAQSDVKLNSADTAAYWATVPQEIASAPEALRAYVREKMRCTFIEYIKSAPLAEGVHDKQSLEFFATKLLDQNGAWLEAFVDAMYSGSQPRAESGFDGTFQPGLWDAFHASITQRKGASRNVDIDIKQLAECFSSLGYNKRQQQLLKLISLDKVVFKRIKKALASLHFGDQRSEAQRLSEDGPNPLLTAAKRIKPILDHWVAKQESLDAKVDKKINAWDNASQARLLAALTSHLAIDFSIYEGAPGSKARIVSILDGISTDTENLLMLHAGREQPAPNIPPMPAATQAALLEEIEARGDHALQGSYSLGDIAKAMHSVAPGALVSQQPLCLLALIRDFPLGPSF